MSETQKYWFAARTRDKQEFAICKSLSRLKSVIRNLVFIRTTKQTACDLSNVYGVRLFYMKDLFTRSMLVVPDKQMSDFMFVMDLNPDGVSFDNGSLVVGDRVRVVKGDLTGVEGEVATNANRTYVVIRIKDILTASVKVPKSYLKIIK